MIPYKIKCPNCGQEDRVNLEFQCPECGAISYSCRKCEILFSVDVNGERYLSGHHRLKSDLICQR